MSRTILFVDDAPIFRELGAVFLARSGRVITAGDGIEALELIRRERPDVVVSDLDMPRMPGDELCRSLRADHELCHIPVVLMTSGDDPESHARAIRSGANDAISKPIRRLHLTQTVGRFLRTPGVRGLPRIDLEVPVRFRERGGPLDEGRLVNLSRGGLFLATDHIVPVAREVELRFQLPELDLDLRPTAQVVWSREGRDAVPTGMGLQFLAIDRSSERRIEEFVYERAPRMPEGDAAPARRAVG